MPPPEGLLFGHDLFHGRDDVIQPVREISAYEALWDRFPTVPKMSALFKKHDHALPSTVALKEGLTSENIEGMRQQLNALLPFKDYSAVFCRDFGYPQGLRSARNPIEVLYYQGDITLLSTKIVSVVGARKATPDGIKRAASIAEGLVKNGYTVMSGLAEGIDTTAHNASLAAKGRTIAVIGTPLNESYPKSNKELQRRIAKDYLLVSQVPFHLTSTKDWRDNRKFFPERNKTMSALSLATVIVEASDTSGTLFQARAAIEQNRKLFILNSCFERRGIEWPRRFQEKGAIRVTKLDQILSGLQ